MNIILLYNDQQRFFTPGSYVKKVLADQDDVSISAHCRIPEDTGICRETCNSDTDLILCIDDGTHFKLHHERGYLPKKVKSAFWVSDLHRNDWAAHRLQMIREWKYDHVFYAQKNFKSMILEAGYKESECSWLPHAVDPDIFKPISWITKRYDIGYVGFSNEKRKKVESVLKDYMKFKHFDSVWAWTANRCLQELKIGFNISVENDINMRVFETMASGTVLLTNDLSNNGMKDLFGENLEDKMLVYSTDSELKEKAVRLIANPDLRKQLAEKARQHVLTFHTYRSRINTIFATMGFEMLKSYV